MEYTIHEKLEEIKHIGKDGGTEFWYARELQPLLGYAKWDNFNTIIEKAKEACKVSDINVSDHFADVGKMVTLGSGAQRKIKDIAITRYGCYLTMQNGDPSKEAIAQAQTYFAVQTRRQELIDEFPVLTEDEKRISIRNELKVHNTSLAEAAQQAGVESPLDYARFQNSGYKGLYNGETKNDIHKRKGLKKSQEILDHMGSEELAANLFRATQTDSKLRRENIKGKTKANKTHYEVGKKVRTTIEELGGAMPEDLPTPEKSVKKLEKEAKKLNE